MESSRQRVPPTYPPPFFFEAITLFHFWKLQVAFLIKKKTVWANVLFIPVVPLRVTATGQCCCQLPPVWSWRFPLFISALWWSSSLSSSPKRLTNWSVNFSNIMLLFSIFNQNWVTFCFDRFISIVMSTSAKDQLAPSLAEAVCTDLALTVSENWGCSFDWVWTTVTSVLIFQEGRREEEELRKFFFTLCTLVNAFFCE